MHLEIYKLKHAFWVIIINQILTYFKAKLVIVGSCNEEKKTPVRILTIVSFRYLYEKII